MDVSSWTTQKKMAGRNVHVPTGLTSGGVGTELLERGRGRLTHAQNYFGLVRLCFYFLSPSFIKNIYIHNPPSTPNFNSIPSPIKHAFPLDSRPLTRQIFSPFNFIRNTHDYVLGRKNTIYFGDNV